MKQQIFFRYDDAVTHHRTHLIRSFHTLGAFCAAALLTFAAGCRPASKSTDPAASGGVTVLDFWNGFTGPDGKTMGTLVKQFNAANPDIQVRMQIIPWGTFYDKLTLSMAYGGTPDVFVIQAARFPEFASFNTLRPIDDLLATDNPPLTEKDFATVPYHASFYDGKQLALPLDTHPIGLYYNKKLFRAAGIVDAQGNAKPPTTREEFLEDAKKLTRDTTGAGGRPDQWGFVITNQHSNWLTFADQFGGGIVSPDGKRGIMSSPESLAATNFMCDLIYKYHVCPKPEGVDAWLAFRTGKAAMALEGIYMVISLQEQKDLEFAGAPVPQFGPKQGVWAGTHLLCEPAGISPERARAGWRFMRFLSDHGLTWGTAGQVPARNDVRESAGFLALPTETQFAREVNYVDYDAQIPRGNSLNQFADPAIEAALLQLQTPEDAMRDADRRIDQLLSRP